MSATPTANNAAKKPLTPVANGRRPAANTTPSSDKVPPNRSPSRMAPQASAVGNGTATSASVNRTRSVRNGARSAPRKPTAEEVEDVKAEMQSRLEELQSQLQAAEVALEDSQKSGSLLQHRLDEALKEQGMLEESVHEHTERVEELENEKKESLRARRELESIYEVEKAERMKEKEDAVAREEELQHAVQRMKESLAQREMRAGLEPDERRPPSASRSSSFRSSTTSPNPENGQFAPPSGLQRSDSRSSSKLVMQKDKIIESLRLELAEAQIKLVEMENLGGGRMQALQKEMYDTKMQNARLMEENESFQLLLSEKTLNGDFAFHSVQVSRPPSRQPGIDRAGGTSLADELADEGVDDSIMTEATSATSTDDQSKRLQAEVNGLKDQNKALTLYINNIISRLLQHEQFEQILDKTPDIMAGPNAASVRHKHLDTEKDLPPPPPPPEKGVESKRQSVLSGDGGGEEGVVGGFLQRAKSVMGGAGRRGRPFSTAVSASDAAQLQSQIAAAEQPKANEDPSTAPRIPIGRSSSTRGGNAGGHRRANSEWAGAVVTNMVRGPSGSGGPTSPGLASPTGVGVRGSGYFAQPRPLGERVPSGSTVPTISENSGKENAPLAPGVGGGQRDSKVASHRSSMTSNPGLTPNNLETPEEPDRPTSNPSSPPRSTTSSGERDTRSGGAVMMGSKPRPLRLVQDAAAQEEAAKKASNRGSWFGWMNKGGAAPTGERSVSGGQGQ